MTNPQADSRGWWEQNPMTYDWERTLYIGPGTPAWFAEVDRRFLTSAYYARTKEGIEFGRFLPSDELRGKKVLEIGCGMGTHAQMLAQTGADVIAVDLTTQATRMTQRRLALYHTPGTICQTDAESLPFPNRSFDFVWSWGVIHHSRNTEQCVREINRVLRPHGRIMLMVYHRSSIVYHVNCGLIRGILFGQLLKKTKQQIYEDSTDGFHARTFTARELTALLSPDYTHVSTTVVGLKAELFAIPRSRVKRFFERFTPDSWASTILSRWGSMIVVEGVKRTV